MFFKTTIVKQLEWNRSRLSRDSSLREEVKNSTIALLHAVEAFAGYCFLSSMAQRLNLPSSKHVGQYSHASKAGACNVAIA